MRTFKPLVLLTLLVAQSASTQAADLNGAWTIDASACGKVFTKENNQLAFKQDADLYAGGLIVRGKQITGTFQECTVKSLHDDGPNVKVIASCSDGVAVSDVAFDVKISGEDRITLSWSTTLLRYQILWGSRYSSPMTAYVGKSPAKVLPASNFLSTTKEKFPPSSGFVGRLTLVLAARWAARAHYHSGLAMSVRGRNIPRSEVVN
jgi:hypothetical protein